MTNQGESVNLGETTQFAGQMTSVSTKKAKLTHWLGCFDTGPSWTQLHGSAGLGFGY